MQFEKSSQKWHKVVDKVDKWGYTRCERLTNRVRKCQPNGRKFDYGNDVFKCDAESRE